MIGLFANMFIELINKLKHDKLEEIFSSATCDPAGIETKKACILYCTIVFKCAHKCIETCIAASATCSLHFST